MWHSVLLSECPTLRPSRLISPLHIFFVDIYKVLLLLGHSVLLSECPTTLRLSKLISSLYIFLVDIYKVLLLLGHSVWHSVLLSECPTLRLSRLSLFVLATFERMEVGYAGGSPTNILRDIKADSWLIEKLIISATHLIPVTSTKYSTSSTPYCQHSTPYESPDTIDIGYILIFQFSVWPNRQASRTVLEMSFPWDGSRSWTSTGGSTMLIMWKVSAEKFIKCWAISGARIFEETFSNWSKTPAFHPSK